MKEAKNKSAKILPCTHEQGTRGTIMGGNEIKFIVITVFIPTMIIQKYSHIQNFESTKLSSVGLVRSDLTTLVGSVYSQTSMLHAFWIRWSFRVKLQLDNFMFSWQAVYIRTVLHLNSHIPVWLFLSCMKVFFSIKFSPSLFFVNRSTWFIY